MPNRIVAGAVAGALGTIAIDVTTFLDMLVRGRPPSQVPGQVAQRMSEEAGLSLGDAERAEHRASAVGALLGYANGVASGVGYAIVRSILPRPPEWLAGAGLGALAMAASDVPAARLGVTDPAGWSISDWAADVVPHLVFGLTTVATFEHMYRNKR